MTETAVQGREYQGVSIPPPGTYELDSVHTVVGFVARHMLSKVRGQFTEFAGTIEVGDSPQDRVSRSRSRPRASRRTPRSGTST
jgi:hypothetical protein